MSEEYTLLSGEVIDTSVLSEEEKKHVSKIEDLINNFEDYFEVYRQAYSPMVLNIYLTPKVVHELRNSARYKIILDLMTIYHREMFPEQ